MFTYTLKVAEIKYETKDTITLCFKQPGLKKIKYLAGQYLTLVFRINGRRYIRPYSFSSAPGIDQFLEVTVKRIQNGVVSNHIHDMIQVGDTIETMPPMGDFIFQDIDIRKVFLWGTGSGITPLMSLAKYILFATSNTTIHLYYGNRNSDTTIFLKEIQKLSSDFPDRLIIKHFHTQAIVSDELPNVVQGRIDKEIALQLIKNEIDNETLHYICGAVGFKESVKNALLEYEVDLKFIHSEDFELVKNPADFENIKTEMVNIQFQDIDYVVEVTKGKSILEAALDNNIELPYSCQTGSCSTCKAKLLRGGSKMIGLVKERNDLEHNEYLLCCTYPTSENTYIKID